MKILKVLLIFSCGFGVTICTRLQIGRRTKQAAFERFDNTCGARANPIIFTYDGLRSEGSKLIMNSTITVKQDILTDPTMLIRIDRCRNRENLDTCEYFYDSKTESYCRLIDSNSPLWTPLFSSYQPKWKCPFKKNVYRAIDSEMDVSAFLLFPVDVWFWRVKIELHNNNTNKMIMCLQVDAHITTKE